MSRQDMSSSKLDKFVPINEHKIMGLQISVIFCLCLIIII